MGILALSLVLPKFQLLVHSRLQALHKARACDIFPEATAHLEGFQAEPARAPPAPPPPGQLPPVPPLDF